MPFHFIEFDFCQIPPFQDDDGQVNPSLNGKPFFLLTGAAALVFRDDDTIMTESINCTYHPTTLLKSEADQSKIYIYTRNGTLRKSHLIKKCSICKTRYFHGYHIADGVRMYDREVLGKCYLVTGSHTAFSIAQVYEWTLYILRGKGMSFSGLANVYNDFHAQENCDKSNGRFNLWEERVTEAFFLYSLLEFFGRAGFNIKFKHRDEDGDKRKWIDRGLQTYHSQLRDYFRIYWVSQHKCDVEGCMWAFISDGGMKVNRKICSAKFSGIREMKHSKKYFLQSSPK